MAGARSRRPDESGDGRRYVLEDQVGHLLRRAHQRATAVFLDRIGNGQLTPMQWAALVKLRDEGPLSQNHLGRLTAMDPATIQGVVRRLRRRGLIERRADANDRRRSVLRLTPAGGALVAELDTNGLGVSEAILEPLDERERRLLLALLRRIG
ncbi:MAG: MarR family transcriptional regulator [Alphaproteobacteria bacterium]